METYEAFMKIDGILDVTPLLGDIDFIIVIEKNTQDEIASTVVKKVRTILGVISTKTMVQDTFVKHFEVLL